MSMNAVIHAAIRRDLERFVQALEEFPVGDSGRAEQLGRAWRNFDQQLTDHHEGEHTIAWPALEQVGITREVLAQMDGEHETMAAALAGARTTFEGLERDASAASAASALKATHHLREVTVTHLDHEEREVEPVYLSHQDDPAIKQMGRRFSRAQGPGKAGTFFAWALDGASPAERSALGETVPGPVLKILTGVFGRGYHKEVAPTWR